MDQDVSFNLIDEPWVRIRDEEGEEREVSLLELFKQAPHIKCLANDLPPRISRFCASCWQSCRGRFLPRSMRTLIR